MPYVERGDPNQIMIGNFKDGKQYCIKCGKEIDPNDPKKNDLQKRYERRWSLHWECKEEIEDILDRITPGAI